MTACFGDFMFVGNEAGMKLFFVPRILHFGPKFVLPYPYGTSILEVNRLSDEKSMGIKKNKKIGTD